LRCHTFRLGAGCDGRMEGSRDLDAQDLWKGRRRWRCAVKEEKEPFLLSFKGGREGAVSEMSPLMRRFENARYSTTHDLHAASLRQLQERHVSAASASSHGPLTAH
jgi:hypothetical protein